MSYTTHLGMVLYHLWWFWGWFIIVLPTLFKFTQSNVLYSFATLPSPRGENCILMFASVLQTWDTDVCVFNSTFVNVMRMIIIITIITIVIIKHTNNNDSNNSSNKNNTTTTSTSTSTSTTTTTNNNNNNRSISRQDIVSMNRMGHHFDLNSIRSWVHSVGLNSGALNESFGQAHSYVCIHCLRYGTRAEIWRHKTPLWFHPLRFPPIVGARFYWTDGGNFGKIDSL